jgi:hypothetical protein
MRVTNLKHVRMLRIIREKCSRGPRCGIFFGLLLVLLLPACSSTKGDAGFSPPLPETRVVNLSFDEFDVYIGRRSNPRVHMLTVGVKPFEEGWLGNPHPIGECELCGEEHTRDECIELFRRDFYKMLGENAEFRRAVLSLKGKRLGCYCKPKNCHGDVIRDFIESER